MIGFRGVGLLWVVGFDTVEDFQAPLIIYREFESEEDDPSDDSLFSSMGR